MNRTHLALAWMLVLLVAFSIPSANLPVLTFELADKLEHAVAFFVLGLLWMRALRGSYTRRAAVTLAIGVLFGVATEVYQGVMPIGRLADPLDAVADAVGTGLAVGVALFASGKKAVPDSNRPGFTVS